MNKNQRKALTRVQQEATPQRVAGGVVLFAAVACLVIWRVRKAKTTPRQLALTPTGALLLAERHYNLKARLLDHRND